MSKRESAENVPLVPFDLFAIRAKRILSNTKKESDAQMARFQASNVKKRQAKKKR